MADIVASKSVAISNLMTNLQMYKRNPSSIQRVLYDHIDEITSGAVDFVDPTNPFIMLLGCSCVNTAMAVNETLVALQKQYPSMSQTEEELYTHLSDKDFLNRFSTPSETFFHLVVQVNDLTNKMVRNELESCDMATIPRDTQFKVDDYTFTLQYPIDFRKYDNGVVQVNYDATIPSPLGDLTTNIIPYTVRTDPGGIQWLILKVPVSQFLINSEQFVLQKSMMFGEDISFTDKFYYARVFYRNAASLNQWTEIQTTHTDQVFDPFVATAVLKAYSDHLNVSIPPIYLNSGLISGDLRVDVYTTKGNITVNLQNYKIDSFALNMMAIDEVRDLNDYTTAMRGLTAYTYSDQLISGGSNGVSFEKLRQQVIFNSTGIVNDPISVRRLESKVNTYGFDLVANVDSVTNRIFLATQKLPKPLNTKLATSANVGISTFITNLKYLETISSVATNNNRTTILSNNLFVSNNGKVSLVTPNEIAALRLNPKSTLVDIVNSNQYLYNPFHCVLDDTDQEFSVRAYNLDYPVASNLSFVSQNPTLQLPVNTGSYNLAKTASGYRLSVVAKSGNFYKDLADGLVSVQLAYYPVGESTLAYINGTQQSVNSDGERVFIFDLLSNFDLDSEDNICITNAKMFGNETLPTWLNLNTTFKLFWATTSTTTTFVPDKADAMLGKFLLPTGSIVSTYENIDMMLGSSLKDLWTRSRTLAVGLTYDTYVADMPLVYDQDVYEKDLVTGSIFSFTGEDGQLTYKLLHKKGDPVLNNAGEPVYRYRKGDVKLDDKGKPIVMTDLSTEKEVDMLFVDGRQFFVDDPAFVAYRDELVSVLDTWITVDIKAISQMLLEQTHIYFYPKTTLGKVQVNIQDNGQDYISSEQSLVVDLYVSADVHGNYTVRQQLIDETVKITDTYISGLSVNMQEIGDALKDIYGSSVKSMDIRGLGGDKNYRIVSLASEHNRLCLKKILELQQNNSLIIKEDVTVNFYLI